MAARRLLAFFFEPRAHGCQLAAQCGQLALQRVRFLAALCVLATQLRMRLLKRAQSFVIRCQLGTVPALCP